MNKNEIKKAFDEIEPDESAKERMYANILKKAAEQKEISAVKPAEAVPQKRRGVPAWQRWSSLAACVAAAVVIGLILPRIIKQPAVDDPPLLAVSPFEDV